MPKAQAARTFCVSLSSVKRYVNKAERGQSLVPKKRPGSAPKLDEKATRLLTQDLEERPWATHSQRAEFLLATCGVSVSEATICRTLRRLLHSRKKGPKEHENETSS